MRNSTGNRCRLAGIAVLARQDEAEIEHGLLMRIKAADAARTYLENERTLP
jgi:hypothetical protein